MVTDSAGSVTSNAATLGVDPTFTKITTGSIVTEKGEFTACAWGDYDNDGWVDLFLANGLAGDPPLDNSLYHNKGDGTFEKILTGSLVNDQARSAICGWADYDNDGFLDLAALIDTLRIEWPSGIVQEFRDVAVKQTLTVPEPARLQVQAPGALRVLCWKGQAFEVQASGDLRQWSAVATLTNLSGTLEFTDPTAASHGQRFDRVVLR